MGSGQVLINGITGERGSGTPVSDRPTYQDLSGFCVLLFGGHSGMEGEPPSMNDKREMLCHFLATLAYRVTKALREAPADFPNFRIAPQVRTPHELVCHITNVLGFGRTYFVGGSWPSRVPTKFDSDITAFYEILAELSKKLQKGSPLFGTTEERLLQGPFSDAMTHAGQLAMLRRLAGSPIRPENFIMASIQTDNVGPDQPPAAAPDREWPEGPEAPPGSQSSKA